MKLAKRISKINPSPTLSITAKAKRMQQEGIDVIGFGAGEPDFDTPLNIKEKAKTAIDKGFTKYTPTSGI
ncbi:MAG: aspartate aminotransferase, partial [Candidatus Omnitrophica bacterium]|nr:aspartate aminotransferase [Candidatus Omnitrophota bacterium]